jgi:hypothetical protein
MTTHAAFNDAIRRAAGRGGYPLRRAPDAPVKVGDVGVGRGGGSAPAPRVTTSGQISERIRASARIARGFTVPGGVSLDSVDLDDLWR